MKKKYWVGVNNHNTIEFFDNDPSSVEGLQAIRQFEVNENGNLSGIDVTSPPLSQTQQTSTQAQQAS